MDWGQSGDRVPIIQYNDGSLYFVHSVNGDGNYFFSHPVEMKKWHNIQIEQKSINQGQVKKNVHHNEKNHLFLG